MGDAFEGGWYTYYLFFVCVEGIATTGAVTLSEGLCGSLLIVGGLIIVCGARVVGHTI